MPEAAPLGHPVEPVRVFVLGGTITMSDHGTGAVPDAEALARLTSDVGENVSVEVLSNTPSGSLAWSDVLELVDRMRAAAHEGTTRFVVAQGTDTIEDVAFTLDLLVERALRVVVTGAMFPSSHPEYDGLSNLRDSIQLARDDAYRLDGALVCLSGDVLRALEVHKVAAEGTPAMAALPGRAGTMEHGRDARPRSEPLPIFAAPPPALPRVAIARVGFGDDGALLRSLPADTAGVVLEGFGAGNIPAAMRDEVAELVSRMPVALATRIRPGTTIEGAYGYPGSEYDLASLGVLSAGALGADKARILLALALAESATGDEVTARFQSVARRAAGA